VDDLGVWSETLRPGGALYCHDYCDTKQSRALGFDVVQAVDDWCGCHNWEITAITDDEWPTVQLLHKS
jgi:hypothetical protein